MLGPLPLFRRSPLGRVGSTHCRHFSFPFEPLGSHLPPRLPCAALVMNTSDLIVAKPVTHPPSSSDHRTGSRGRGVARSLGTLSPSGLRGVPLSAVIYLTGRFSPAPPADLQSLENAGVQTPDLCFPPSPLTQSWSLLPCHDFKSHLYGDNFRVYLSPCGTPSTKPPECLITYQN